MTNIQRWALRLLPLVVALLGPWNTVDELLRGKWVRHWGTEEGERVATLCLPAQSPDELQRQLEQLPEKLSLLEQAGAAVVGVDLGDFGGDSHLRVGGLVHPAHAEMVHSKLPPAVLGAAPERGGRPHLSLAALEALTSRSWSLEDEPVLFMPYLIPFLHWDHPEDWAEIAHGRVVFVGACRLDRELTRYGRQPGPVAHGEILETLIDEVWILRAPRWADLLVALGLGALSMVLGRRWPGRGGLLGAGLAAGSLLSLLVLAQTGLWLDLSGAVLAALSWAWAERP